MANLEDQNVATLKEAYRQWHDSKGGSVDHWMGLLADEVKFRSLAEGATGMEFSADRSNKQEVMGYLETLSAEWEMIRYTPHQYVAQGDWVAVLGRCAWRHRQTEKSVATPKADFWRFKDGKIVAFYEFYDTAAAFEAARES